MALAPSASITLGNERFDSHAAQVTVSLSLLPAVGTFAARFPSTVSLSAAAGDDAALDVDGGEGAELVLTGKVRAVRRGIHGTDVLVADAGADLGALRPASTYTKKDANAVIKALASDAGVTVGSSAVELSMPLYVAHQRRTAAEHISDLAALMGAVARINADGELDVDLPLPFAGAALRYGREVISCEVSEGTAPAAEIVRTGSGTAAAASAPNALRPSKEPLPAGARDPGADAVWIPTPLLRTPMAALGAGLAAGTSARAVAKRIHGTAFLVPALRPGIVLEIQDLPSSMPSGAWLLTRVTHVLDGGDGGRTHFEGREAASLDLGALAGAALSAIGGLL